MGNFLSNILSGLGGHILPGLQGNLNGTAPSLQTFQNMTPQQQAALQQMLTQLTGNNAPGTQAYGGQITANQNQAQQSSLTALEQQSLQNATGQNLAPATGALTGILNSQPQDLTSYFQKAFVDPTMQAFNQQILPAIDQRFSGMSGYGSDKILQDSLAASNTATGLGSQLAQTALTAQQAQVQNKINAAQGLGQLSSTAINNTLGLQQGANTAQQIAQTPLSNQYAEFQRQTGAQQLNINQILQALQAQTTTPVVVGGKSGILSGGSGSAIGAGVGAFLGA